MEDPRTAGNVQLGTVVGNELHMRTDMCAS